MSIRSASTVCTIRRCSMHHVCCLAWQHRKPLQWDHMGLDSYVIDRRQSTSTPNWSPMDRGDLTVNLTLFASTQHHVGVANQVYRRRVNRTPLVRSTGSNLPFDTIRLERVERLVGWSRCQLLICITNRRSSFRLAYRFYASAIFQARHSQMHEPFQRLSRKLFVEIFPTNA